MSVNASNILTQKVPVPDLNLDDPGNEFYKRVFDNLQGNILKGHGRDFSSNIFVRFTADAYFIKSWLKEQSGSITSAAIQLEESRQFNRFGIPGSLFKGIYLAKSALVKLEIPDLVSKFPEAADPETPVEIKATESSFLGGMKTAEKDLADNAESMAAKPITELDPLEIAYLAGTIDCMILLADDSESFLQRTTRSFISQFERGTSTMPKMGDVVAVELGKALRNQDGEGIEHFGYVDGRSQPLFLASDFHPLVLTATGEIDLTQTKEKINEKATRKESGDIDIWNPFASLDHVLIRDKTVSDDDSAFGSYFVFRKLEQDVMRFTIKEQTLADNMGLLGSDRERAGAMAVGRFRDGTPLTLSQNDGMIPAKANNYRYDGLDASATTSGSPVTNPDDIDGLRCPYHAHIRKTNPRQATPSFRKDKSVPLQDSDDRGRQITRRGIPYGDRNKSPNTFQALDDLPTKNVGLLFACFQSSIQKQFAFMQKSWANNEGFRRPGTGIDPLIGQHKSDSIPTPHTWNRDYGVSSEAATNTFADFVKFRGGEFFFAPSIRFFATL